VDAVRASQALPELPADPALRIDALGRPEIVEYDPADADHLRLHAAPEVRRQWARRRGPRQRWVEQHEIEAMETGRSSEVLDLFS
jgi:hypothetical protein